ncbi:hypothetical protein NONO_c63180 [Nocardia nova SH22a]|uniref:Uncharacterized protein n=1 Tax=Nocardia nova SH22a TaxID=1415166 RepID=W5TQ57_9NOCA|nr:hypothetical protein NONO_c63180 [Nocardia nova SH22a]
MLTGSRVGPSAPRGIGRMPVTADAAAGAMVSSRYARR